MINNIAFWVVLLFSLFISIIAVVFSFFAWNRSTGEKISKLITENFSRNQTVNSKAKQQRSTEKMREERLREIEYILYTRDQIADRWAYRQAEPYLQKIRELEKSLDDPRKTETQRKETEKYIRRLIQIVKGILSLTYEKEILDDIDYIKKRQEIRRKDKSQ